VNAAAEGAGRKDRSETKFRSDDTEIPYPHDHSGGHRSSLDLHRRLSASSSVIALAASTYNRRSSVIGHWGVGAKADFRRLLRIWPKIMPLVTQCCRLAALGSQQYM